MNTPGLSDPFLSTIPLPPQSSLQKKYRIGLFMLTGITFLCLAGIPAIGLVSALLTYDGKCYGFTDGVSDCTFATFAGNETAYMLIFATVFIFALGFIWGALAGYLLVTKIWKRLSETRPAWTNYGWLRNILTAVAVLTLGIAGGFVLYVVCNQIALLI
jgi:hypothetical protein